MKNRITLNIIFLILLCLNACTGRNQADDTRFRPHLHFAGSKNWTGEPAGAVWYEGEYHLFYLHNPEAAVLGNICWGHAVSRDLVHWEERPVAIPSDPNGQIYPGSVVIDKHNSSGLGSDDTPPWIAFFTYHETDKTTDSAAGKICSAYSTDKGLTWTKLDLPVLEYTEKLTHPNVSHNDSTGQWLMSVSTGTSIRFYSSSDCLEWDYLSTFGEGLYSEGGWENSSLFPLPVAGSNQTKWILLVGMNGGPADGSPGIRYFVGDFNGSRFKLTQTQELWADYGKDCSAGTICNNTPDNRKIMLNWMNSWDYANLTPTCQWRGNTTLPRNLGLVPEGNYYLLTSSPIDELAGIYGKKDSIDGFKYTGSKKIFATRPLPRSPYLLQLRFDNTARRAIWGARDYGIRFITRSGKKLTIGYKAELNSFYVNRAGLRAETFSDSYEQPVGATYTFNAPIADWNIWIDHNSIELFACGNRIVLTALCYPDEPFESVELFSEAGSSTLVGASLTELNGESGH